MENQQNIKFKQMNHFMQTKYYTLNVMQYNVLAEIYGVRNGINAEAIY